MRIRPPWTSRILPFVFQGFNFWTFYFSPLKFTIQGFYPAIWIEEGEQEHLYSQESDTPHPPAFVFFGFRELSVVRGLNIRNIWSPSPSNQLNNLLYIIIIIGRCKVKPLPILCFRFSLFCFLLIFFLFLLLFFSKGN